MTRVKISIELGGNEEFEVDLSPRFARMGDNPAQLASLELDRAVADARAWLAARGASQEEP